MYKFVWSLHLEIWLNFELKYLYSSLIRMKLIILIIYICNKINTIISIKNCKLHKIMSLGHKKFAI